MLRKGTFDYTSTGIDVTRSHGWVLSKYACCRFFPFCLFFSIVGDIVLLSIDCGRSRSMVCQFPCWDTTDFVPTWQSGVWDRTHGLFRIPCSISFGVFEKLVFNVVVLLSTRGFRHQRGGLEEVERCGFQYFAIRRLRHAQGLWEKMEGFRKYLVVYKTQDLRRLARFEELSCLCHVACG